MTQFIEAVTVVNENIRTNPMLVQVAAPGGGGAAAFTDLTDAPNMITPSGVVCGNDDGSALRVSDVISINEAGDVVIAVPGDGTLELSTTGAGGVVVSGGGEGGLSLNGNGAGGVVISGNGDGGVVIGGNGNGGIHLNATAGEGAEDSQIALNLSGGAPLKVNGQAAVATQSVLVAGVGTMVFTHGILTTFTPA